MGGGVTGDLAGFVAATYLRGIPIVQVPTTLLAMVDASVGGKTGVDTPLGKNLVGAFHQPEAVVADPLVLLTQPEADFRDGLAEAVKHGLIADAGYFDWIEHHAERLMGRDTEALVRLVAGSVQIKANLVGRDERESGQRAVLNAGHTVGHALEHASSYRIPHGAAVAIGLVAETRLGEQIGATAPGTARRLRALLERLGLPVTAPAGLDGGALEAAARRDKKNRGGRIRLALAAEVGRMAGSEGEWTVDAEWGSVARALDATD